MTDLDVPLISWLEVLDNRMQMSMDLSPYYSEELYIHLKLLALDTWEKDVRLVHSTIDYYKTNYRK